MVRIHPVAARLLAVVAATFAFAGCGDDDGASSATTVPAADSADPPDTTVAGEELFPDVVEVELTPVGDDRFEVTATLSSPYDSPERYADAWRVLDENGDELGVRELAHDHASEQPFTRSEVVTIPADVDEVTVEGRDQVSGYGGETVTVAVPRG